MLHLIAQQAPPFGHPERKNKTKESRKIGGGNDGDAGEFEVGKPQIFLGIFLFPKVNGEKVGVF